MLQDDEKYKALRDSLRALPRVKAKKDFEARLMQRISEANNPAVVHVAQKVKTESHAKSWFANLFRPAFVPALGLTFVLMITVIVYFAYFSKLNNGSPDSSQQFVTSTNQGDLIIYVKKDADDISGNYPKEYSAVNPEDTRSGELFAPPVETPSDFLAKPDPGRTMLPDNKPDRVSEEQKLEMQRSVDLDKEKGVDFKGERKSDDGIMKKDSKGYFKSETKGELKSETEKSPYNIRDEKSNEKVEDTPEVNQETKVAPKKKTNKTEDSINQQTDEESQNRISRATKKDSTKNKSDSEAEEKENNKK